MIKEKGRREEKKTRTRKKTSKPLDWSLHSVDSLQSFRISYKIT